MKITDFSLIRSIFSVEKLSDDDELELFGELLYMVLTHASAADLHLDSIEVEKILEILSRHIDHSFTAAEIRAAALTDLYELASYERYVAVISRKLTVDRRLEIVDAMKELMHSDGTTGALEADFFNKTVQALDLTPAQITGLRK